MEKNHFVFTADSNIIENDVVYTVEVDVNTNTEKKPIGGIEDSSAKAVGLLQASKIKKRCFKGKLILQTGLGSS